MPPVIMNSVKEQTGTEESRFKNDFGSDQNLSIDRDSLLFQTHETP